MLTEKCLTAFSGQLKNLCSKMMEASFQMDFETFEVLIALNSVSNALSQIFEELLI